MRGIRTIAAAGCLLIVSMSAAHAQNINTIDTVVSRFQTVANGWTASLQSAAQNTFFILATIQLFWAMAKLVFRNADFSEFLAELINQIMFIGLFLWLLTTTTTWGPAIINSFRQAAGTAGGMTQLTPGDVFKVGLNIAGQIWSQMSIWSPAASPGLAIAAFLVLACFAWIVLTMVTALVESYFVISGGVLLMAFGGSRWTSDIAVGVIRNVFGIGAKLFALQLVVSVGSTFIQQWSTQFTNVTAQGLFIEICQALVLAGITKTIPDMFQRMVGGVATGNGGAIIGAAAALAGATTGLAMETAKFATAVAGFGALTGAAAQLAGTQMAARDAAGTGPASRAGRIASMAGMTVQNMASGTGTDIGHRLSGQSMGRGSAGFRVAADLNERSRLQQEESNAPVPPSGP